ncbi:MAG: hypothetical protein RL071_785 [Pseudomonadota bacterium]|jgi:EAL domain-containing protein (putative c-di-GMP-specific phosphodiesterase class I)
MARILVVDDDAMTRRLQARALTRSGHEVAEASDGVTAVRLCTERSFALALVALQLPDLSGVEVLRRMRAAQPGCMRLLMAPEVDLPQVVGAVNQGEVNRVLDSVLSADHLLAAVEDLLRTRAAMQDVLRVQEEAASAEERQALLECLRSDAVRLALQPILDARSHGVFAFEALLRSRNLAFPGPLSVLRAAEKHRLLHEMAEVVVDRVAAWMPQLPPPVHLFMNLHPDELGDPDALVARLTPLLPWSRRIVLEITERSRLQAIDQWEQAVDSLTDMGFALAVDDLGAGHSSLAVLAELQPSFIKVDMSIVRGVDADPRKQRLINLLCRFADATQARFVAEGVETAAEAEVLRDCGAHLLQGYHFGRPSFEPEAHLARWGTTQALWAAR